MVLDSSVKVKIKVSDLLPSSHVKIKYKCDNCGKIEEISYSSWNKRKYKEMETFCKDCTAKIIQPQIMYDKYKTNNCVHLDWVIEKKKETNLKKYGNEWAIASKEIRNSILKTFEEKYHVDNLMKNQQIKEKALKTLNEKYGGNSCTCDAKVIEKIKQTCLEKYGVKNVFQVKSFQEKARKTLYKNDTVPSSVPEKLLCNMLKEIYGKNNCFPKYPFECYSFDCLVVIDKIKIDVEYDGLYWHKNRKQKDGARNVILLNEGFRILRILGNNKDILPTNNQIKEAINSIIYQNKHLVFINMNN